MNLLSAKVSSFKKKCVGSTISTLEAKTDLEENPLMAVEVDIIIWMVCLAYFLINIFLITEFIII
jgi:hypothetical protein